MKNAKNIHVRDFATRGFISVGPLEAGHWATEGIRGAVYRAVAGRSRIIHTDTAIGTIEVPNEHT